MTLRSITHLALAAAALAMVGGCAAPEPAHGQEQTLDIATYNIELGGRAQPAVVAKRIAALPGVDLWGLCEVERGVVTRLARAAEQASGAGFRSVLGSTGGADRLAILYNHTMFELVESYELDYINTRGRHRAPLVVHFRSKDLSSEFLFMVNHLARKDTYTRHQQARLLNRWAATQQMPVIAVGDYNFDYDVERGDNPRHRDRGFDLLTRDGVFTWVRPERLRKTQSSRHETVLDFTFVAGDAALWEAESVIVVDPKDLDFGPPTDTQRSDHRPVLTTFFFDERALSDQAQRHEARRPILEPEGLDTLRHARSVETMAGRLIVQLERMLPQVGVALNGR